MMKVTKISLLDCTLRDGGYVNDWKFGHDNMVSIFERVVDAGTDIIEVGFLDERRPYDYNRSIMPDTDCVEKIFGNLNRKNTKVFGMIDYGTCSLDHIKPCSECYLDGIRVIFKKHLRQEALEFCAELKKLGYIVFAQLVSVTAYSDEELVDLCNLANAKRPDAVSMVDTYGLTHQKDLRHILEILDNNLAKDIAIGYHGHNNFQMGYANCQMILAYSKETDRDLLVDGTLYGMGKSAGNAPIELVAMHMNNEYGKEYHLSQYLEAIDANIMQFYQPATWGYSMFFFIAASNDCHPDYVKQLTNKHTLSIKQMNELLGRLEGEKKLLYDKNYMEKLYLEFQDMEINDEQSVEALANELQGKTILVTGPGKTMETEGGKVGDFVMSRNPVIISINYASRVFMPNYIFLTNSKRYIQVATILSNEKIPIIATSNLTPTDKPFEHVVNISELLDRDSEYADNSLMMLLKVLMRCGVKEVNLAGFDGYSGTDDNYLDVGKEYEFAKQKADYLNNYMSGFIRSHKDDIKVNFLTSTRYDVT